jgi:hypothetical protein
VALEGVALHAAGLSSPGVHAGLTHLAHRTLETGLEFRVGELADLVVTIDDPTEDPAALLRPVAAFAAGQFRRQPRRPIASGPVSRLLSDYYKPAPAQVG